jgi:hypothetical protein
VNSILKLNQSHAFFSIKDVALSSVLLKYLKVVSQFNTQQLQLLYRPSTPWNVSKISQETLTLVVLVEDPNGFGITLGHRVEQPMKLLILSTIKFQQPSARQESQKT